MGCRFTAKGVATSTRALLRTVNQRISPGKLPHARSSITPAQRARSLRVDDAGARLGGGDVAPTSSGAAMVAHNASSSMALDAAARIGA